MNSEKNGWWETSRRHSAFTLVELLVVIGLITMLTGILLAVGNQAIVRTRRVVCQNNLRQVGVLWDGYFRDNECFPQGIDTDLWFGGWNSEYAIRQKWPWPRPLSGGMKLADRSSAKVFCCPADAGGAPGPSGVKVFDRYGTSYAANILLIGQNAIGKDPSISKGLWTGINERLRLGVTLEMVTNSKEKVILAGDYGWGRQWMSSPTSPPNRRLEWHGKACSYNVLFVSGGVGFVEVKAGAYYVKDEYYILPFRELNSLWP